MSDSEESDDNFDPQEYAIVMGKGEDQAKVESHPNNKVGMLTKLTEFTLPDKMAWVETLQVTSTNPFSVDNVHDDLVREAEL